VRDQRFVYVRNYLPHLADGQHVAYMFETPTTRTWKRLYDAGELPSEQAAFWEPRPAEELYDLSVDPDEVVNLAGSPDYREVLQRMRMAQRLHAIETVDLGFLPEAEMYRRAGLTALGGEAAPQSGTLFDLARDVSRYHLVRIVQVAEQAGDTELVAAADLRPALRDPDSAVRYWAAVGMLLRGASAVRLTHDELSVLLADESPNVRIAAAEALARYGDDGDLQEALEVLLMSADLDSRPLFEVVAALNAIDHLGGRAAGARERIASLPREHAKAPAPFGLYVPRLVEKVLDDLRAGGVTGVR
jgi:uncharacterized sulfatase